MDMAFDHPAFEFVGCSEYDKHASAVLKFHWPEIKNYEDITKIRIEDLPKHQVLLGGTPCQSFSEAGKREGLKGKSGLLLYYLKVLKVHRPRYFVWENVIGCLNSTSGWDFARLQSEVAKMGYSIRWEVLNARNYGIPQNRERVFVVGYHRKFKRGREILREGHLAKEVYRREYFDYQDDKEETVGHDFKVLAYSKSTREKHLDHRIRPDGTANTLNTGDGCRSQSSATFVASFNRTEGLRTKKKIAHALSSSDWRGVNRNTSANVVAHPNYRIRKLMPLECERLMGWASHEKIVTLRLCSDQVKNFVNVVMLNPKLLKLVSAVERGERPEIAELVEKSLPLRSPLTKNTVQESATSQTQIIKKSITTKRKRRRLSADNVVLKKQSENQRLGDFSVLPSVGVTITRESTTQIGKVEYQVNETDSITQDGGKHVLSMSGNEMMLLVDDAPLGSSMDDIKFLKYTTLYPLGLNAIELMSAICYFYATNVIAGFTPKKIQKDCLSITLILNIGHTEIGDYGSEIKTLTDTQRYKFCGNGVVTPCVIPIRELILGIHKAEINAVIRRKRCSEK